MGMAIFFLVLYGVFVFILPFLVFGIYRWLSRLDDRLSELESEVDQIQGKEAAPSITPPEPAPLEEAEVVLETPPVPTPPAEIEVAAEPAPAQPTEIEAEVTPTRPPRVRAWLRKSLSEEEWEATVGGSWLNKAGVLILVIGLAFFLGYSLRYFGPAGRVGVGLVVSFTMLIAGVLLERRPRYVTFSWGLIGGGWAALYFTTYAAHALEAARIIDNPLTGMILLALVAAGMIAHSLRYRSEVVTGMAYVIGFLTVAISPVSSFSIIASVPLVASLLVVARRFSWIYMVVFGLIATYGVYALRYSLAAGIDTEPISFTNGQTILIVYWLLFESFDLLDLRIRKDNPSLVRTLFPLNACGFIGVSLFNWQPAYGDNLYIFFAAASAAYLASSLIRTRIRPPSSFKYSPEFPLERLVAGGYEGAITVAAGLAIVAIFKGIADSYITIALLLEAEMLFFAGIMLRQSFLRYLGGVIVIFPIGKLLAVDILTHSPSLPAFASAALKNQTPEALLTAAALYLNRLSLSPTRKSKLELYEQWWHSTAGVGLLVFVLVYEVPIQYLGTGLLLLATPLFELGLRERFNEFRLQSYAVAVIGLATLSAVNIFGIIDAPKVSPWLAFGLGAASTYGIAIRLYYLAPDRLVANEKRLALDTSLAAGTILLATLLWALLPVPLVALGWGALALALIELGFYLPLQTLRTYGNIAAIVTFGRLFLGNFTNMGETVGISHRVLTVAPFIYVFYYLASRFSQNSVTDWEKKLSRIYLYAPAVLAAVLIRFEFGRSLAVIGWAVLMLVLLYFGKRRENRDLRWQSYVLAVLTFFRCWATNFYIPEVFIGQFGRIAIGVLVIGSLFAAQLMASRHPENIPVEGKRIKRWATFFDLHARAVFALFATILLAALLYYEVPGRMLTVAWALEGTALLVLGFPMRERALRMYGLLLLSVCIFKVFLYDLQELETVFRILSFIVLGLLLLGASLLYTRFREQLSRYF
jgi:hypothetical protein